MCFDDSSDYCHFENLDTDGKLEHAAGVLANSYFKPYSIKNFLSKFFQN